MQGLLSTAVRLEEQWLLPFLLMACMCSSIALHLGGSWRRKFRVANALAWIFYVGYQQVVQFMFGRLLRSDLSAWSKLLIVVVGMQAVALPDSMQAYSMEDNNLWLRHALALASIVLSALYTIWADIAKYWWLSPLLVFQSIRYWEQIQSLRYASQDKLGQLGMELYIAYSSPHVKMQDLIAVGNTHLGSLLPIQGSNLLVDADTMESVLIGQTIATAMERKSANLFMMEARYGFWYEFLGARKQTGKRLTLALACLQEAMHQRFYTKRGHSPRWWFYLAIRVTMIAAYVGALAEGKKHWRDTQEAAVQAFDDEHTVQIVALVAVGVTLFLDICSLLIGVCKLAFALQLIGEHRSMQHLLEVPCWVHLMSASLQGDDRRRLSKVDTIPWYKVVMDDDKKLQNRALREIESMVSRWGGRSNKGELAESWESIQEWLFGWVVQGKPDADIQGLISCRSRARRVNMPPANSAVEHQLVILTIVCNEMWEHSPSARMVPVQQWVRIRSLVTYMFNLHFQAPSLSVSHPTAAPNSICGATLDYLHYCARMHDGHTSDHNLELGAKHVQEQVDDVELDKANVDGPKHETPAEYLCSDQQVHEIELGEEQDTEHKSTPENMGNGAAANNGQRRPAAMCRVWQKAMELASREEAEHMFSEIPAGDRSCTLKAVGLVRMVMEEEEREQGDFLLHMVAWLLLDECRSTSVEVQLNAMATASTLASRLWLLASLQEW